MALALWRLPQPARLIVLPHVRGRLKLRGKPPGVALSLEERLGRLQGPPLTPINIGFRHQVSVNRHELAQVVRRCRADRTLERAARDQKLKVPLYQVEAEWKQSQGPEQARSVAEHYGVFESLFGSGVFFTPVVPLSVEYPLDSGQDEECAVVHVGNVIKPAEARRRPHVTFSAPEGSLWTLVCTNLEGWLDGNAPELLHWLVTDIPAGGGADAGRQVCDYLQPLPFRGTGYHRLALVLYRQRGAVQALPPPLAAADQQLAARGFSTPEFYRRHEDVLTPAGLAFFQTDWDSSVMEYFHTRLQRKEPIFEYDWKPPYVRRQKWFPKAESVVHYFDKYADPRDLQKQMLLKRLAMVHPFEGVTEGPKYPLAVPKERGKRPPTWIINEQRKEARKIGKYYYIDRRPETVFDPCV